MRAGLMLGGAVRRTAGQAELYVEGSSKALEQPEFADPGRLRELLRALEDKSALLDLLERSLKQNSLMVSIGSENFDLRLSGFSVIAASYARGSVPPESPAVVVPATLD